MITKITNLVDKIYDMKLSKNGKQTINKWLLDEFGSIYYAQKQLDGDTAILDFLHDMLTQENIELTSLCMQPEETKNTSKHVQVRNKTKYFKYCPYCGEYIDFK